MDTSLAKNARKGEGQFWLEELGLGDRNMRHCGINIDAAAAAAADDDDDDEKLQSFLIESEFTGKLVLIVIVTTPY